MLGNRHMWRADEKIFVQDSYSWYSLKKYISRRWRSTTLAAVKLANPLAPSLRPTAATTPPSQSTQSNAVFILLCGLWYSSSALSSNTGKAILMQFRYPVTLTFIQFGFVAFYCLLSMSPLLRISRLRRPTKAILKDTLAMGLFQVGGHMFSSIAISRIHVSTVHTIKALSPLFTVAAYALLFKVKYSAKTYISLLPLTAGVMLACSFDMSASDFLGLLCAFGSALVFVSSNIFFKKIMPSTSSLTQASSPKLDKLNLLLYSSGMAFLLMIPIWIYSDFGALFLSPDGPTHIAHPRNGHSTPHSVSYYFFMNGTVHFGQNIIAFVILSSTSPVTYSIASLIKRVVVICIAIVWFSQSIHPVQGFGIVTTFVGLYMYNNAKSDVERGETKVMLVTAQKEMVLPMTKGDANVLSGTASPPTGLLFGQVLPVTGESTGTGITTILHGRPRAPSTASSSISPHARHTHRVYPSQGYVPHLTIKVVPPASSYVNDCRLIVSPTESYPSPPPSLDSPPTTAALLTDIQQGHPRLTADGRREVFAQ